MEIKILGPGCPKCDQVKNLVMEAVKETGAEVNVEKITDAMKIASYGVFGTPAIVIDGQVKSVGKIPTKDQVKEWLS